ncbi:MAG: helix-turn-helix transcriptional regulator, partial [Spirochaetota bacterium]
YYILEAAGFMMFLIVGPLNYAYCRAVISPGSPFSKRNLLHFLPAAIFAAVYLPAMYVKAAEGHTPLSPDHRTVYLLSIIAAVISFDTYMIVCLKKVLPLLKKYPNRNVIFKMMAGTFLFALATVSFWPFDILLDINFTDDIRVATSLYLITLYVISRRHPERMIFLDSETESNKYLKTQLQGMNVGTIIAQLDSLMDKEKIYKSKITLKDLAGRLNIRQHQLSEILNAYMKTTFPNYINDRRVAEAGRQLGTEPEMQIVEIALEVGYDSLSVFYKEFKKRTGISPAEYRRQKLPQ